MEKENWPREAQSVNRDLCAHISGFAKMSPQELSVWAKSLNIINANQVNKCTQLSKCKNDRRPKRENERKRKKKRDKREK